MLFGWFNIPFFLFFNPWELVEMVGWLMADFVPSLLFMESSYRMGISKTLKLKGYLKDVNFFTK